MINCYGFAFVENVPTTLEGTRQLAERITFLKETFYGTLWDFKPNLKHGDMAYTSAALKGHTDTTYFSEPVGLQMLHLLEQTGMGGQSFLIDGFYVAEQLKKKHPEAYKMLSVLPVPFRFVDKNECYVPEVMPILRHSSTTGELYQIRYNNEDRDVMNHLKPEEVEGFYQAFRIWTQLLRDPHYEYTFQLRPGTPVIFDNWRILHGRTAFSGNRHVAGCYLGHDEWTSRLRSLRRSLK
jgi:trimethyllysine dioxygenase